MSFDLRIYRPAPAPEFSKPISASEWRDAVASTDGARLIAHSEITSEILQGSSPEASILPNLDVEIYIASSGEWRHIIHWRRDDAVLNADSIQIKKSFFGIFGKAQVNVKNPVWQAVSKLAKQLNAVIESDDGERYDLLTGNIIPESEVYS